MNIYFVTLHMESLVCHLLTIVIQSPGSLSHLSGSYHLLLIASMKNYSNKEYELRSSNILHVSLFLPRVITSFSPGPDHVRYLESSKSPSYFPGISRPICSGFRSNAYCAAYLDAKSDQSTTLIAS